MDYKEYKDKNNIKKAKKMLWNVVGRLRDYAHIERIRFGNEIVGSGKNGIILIPENEDNQGYRLFDIDSQIMITGNWNNEEDWRIKFLKIRHELIKIFESIGFTLSNGHRRCYKFYSKNKVNSTNNFSFEIVFTVYDKKEQKKYEIIINEYGKPVRQPQGTTIKPEIYQKMKKIKQKNMWSDLVKKYINKRIDDEETPHYRLFVQSVNEVLK